MFQLLPALILLLLQGQSHSNRILTEKGSETFLRAVYSQDFDCLSKEKGQAVERSVLIRLLVASGNRGVLVERLLGWLHTYDLSCGGTQIGPHLTPTSIQLSGSDSPPREHNVAAILGSAQRLRDGPV